MALCEIFQTALVNLQEVLEQLRIHNLKLKPNKCALLQKQVRNRGRFVRPDGISIADELACQIKDWPIARTHQQMEYVLGFYQLSSRIFRGFAETVDINRFVKEKYIFYEQCHQIP